VASLTGGSPWRRAGQLGELRLIVNPLVLGNGKQLFENKDDRRVLEFVDTRTLGTGVI